MVAWTIYLIGNLLALAIVALIMYVGILLITFAYRFHAPAIERDYSDELKKKLFNSTSKNYWSNLFKLVKDYWEDLTSKHTNVRFKFLLIAGTVIASPLLIAGCIFGYIYLLTYDYMAN